MKSELKKLTLIIAITSKNGNIFLGAHTLMSENILSQHETESGVEVVSWSLKKLKFKVELRRWSRRKKKT